MTQEESERALRDKKRGFPTAPVLISPQREALEHEMRERSSTDLSNPGVRRQVSNLLDAKIHIKRRKSRMKLD